METTEEDHQSAPTCSLEALFDIILGHQCNGEDNFGSLELALGPLPRGSRWGKAMTKCKPSFQRKKQI